ncbi:MAG: hypothetical protein BBJ57_10945 [Desulfobacterales bacterium PC51MH44]|nr:MAG: hypothetical protein BBJ57_10945 [Desulfobacterales bacterium PC51MH44]
MRLLILLAIIYLCYRALKSWMLKGKTTQKTVFGKTAAEIDDIMVKDPFCEVYFPKRDGVHLKVDGKDLYFCSTECRDKYVASQSKA